MNSSVLVKPRRIALAETRGSIALAETRGSIAIADDRGSIAPLAIGLASFLLAATFTFVNAGAALLFQERQTQQAEALALAVDEALTPAQLRAGTSDTSALFEQASRFAAEAGILDFDIDTPDGLTVEAKVCGVFEAPIIVPLVPQNGSQTVCEVARARRG